MPFDEFFERATGAPPYAYQRRLAEEGLPDVLQAPMGAGKTPALILAWLWRLLSTETAIQVATPRRLVFALPMRTLVEQVEVNTRVWLDRLGLDRQVLVNVVMGGHRSEEKQWRLEAHRPSITIGTVDSLVSKALLRGYGVSRAVAPMDFALISNGTHVVIDEIQLAPAATATLRQLSAFQRQLGTAEPVGLTCASATVDQRILDVIDNPAVRVHSVSLGADDRTGRLGQLLSATKSVRQLLVDATDHRAIAQHAATRHRPGTRTLVVVNTVKNAVGIARALLRTRPAAEVVLVHSRFRGRERAALSRRVTRAPGPDGTIVVATQVVEAGVDIDSAVMIAEASPWPSLCQRSGRCNRYAVVEDAELWWYAAGTNGPYDQADLDETERVLAALEGQPCTGESLLAQDVAPSDLALQVIRRSDFLSLFDTAPDLSGNDIDVSPYIRTGEQLDCQMAWIDTETRGPLDPGFRPPDQEWRCPAPLGEVRRWLNPSIRAWTFSPVSQRWDRVDRLTRLRPGEVIVVHADDGGYDPEFGFTPGHQRRVETGSDIADEGGDATDAINDDSTNIEQSDWLSLDAHLQQSADQAAGLLSQCRPSLPGPDALTVTAAALLHDVGKLHPAWQEALRNTAPQRSAPDGLLAKSPGHHRLDFTERRGLRHELVSALLVSSTAAQPLLSRAGVDGAESTILLRYLVAAHHGKIRVQIPPIDADQQQILGVRQGEPLPGTTILDAAVPEWKADLARLAPGEADSWTGAALELLERYGPFRLAYMEAVVRIADWRASAGLALAGSEVAL